MNKTNFKTLLVMWLFAFFCGSLLLPLKAYPDEFILAYVGILVMWISGLAIVATFYMVVTKGLENGD